MSEIILKNQSSLFEFDTLGGRIKRLTLVGANILTNGMRPDSKAFSTHVCLPNFSKSPQSDLYNLPQHGDTRDREWIVKNQNENILEVELDNVGGGIYPRGLHTSHTYTLDNDSLQIDISIYNTSNLPLPVNYGLHCYFAAPLGWDEVTFENQNIAQLIRDDRSIALPMKVNTYGGILTIPNIGNIKILTNGLPMARAWTWRDDAKSNFAKDWFCFEPIQGNPERFATPVSLLAPGQKITLKIKLSTS